MISRGSLSDSNGVGPFVSKPDPSVFIGAKTFLGTIDLRMGLLNRCFSGDTRPDFLGFPDGGLGMWNGNEENSSVIKGSSPPNSSDNLPAVLLPRGFLATGSTSSVPPLARIFFF